MVSQSARTMPPVSALFAFQSHLHSVKTLRRLEDHDTCSRQSHLTSPPGLL